MKTKQQLYEFCKTFISKRIYRIQKNIKEVRESLGSETKSSAGDKHETGRAMLQLEREKLGQQLAEAEKTQKLLSKVPLKNPSKRIGLGSLVYTDTAKYYIAISAGEFKQDNTSVFCISAATPIGKLLLGKQAGESYVFHGKEIKIISVF